MRRRLRVAVHQQRQDRRGVPGADRRVSGLIALASTGYDATDVAAADRLGIAVTNSQGTLHETTADLAFALILSARRRLGEAERYIRAGLWAQDGLDLLLGEDIHGATLGIVGYGQIGQAVARRAQGSA